MIQLLIALTVASSIFYISFLNWRGAVKSVFFLLVLEGVLRKWVLPQASELIYFLKDIVLLGAYIRYFGFTSQWKKSVSFIHPINIFLLINLGWLVFLSFNPSLGSPLVGLWGIRNYMFYVPLMWILPNTFSSLEEFYRFLRSHLLLLIPVGLLGIIQYFSPPSSILNAYAPGLETESIAGFGLSNRVRITGPFPYVNNYVPYLVVCFGLLVTLFSFKQKRNWFYLSVIELLLVIINTFMTGSRTTVIASGLLIVGYLMIKGLTQFSSTIRILQQTLPPGLVLIVLVTIRFQEEINRILDRVLYTQDMAQRIKLLFLEPLGYVHIKQIDAFGPGAAHQATGLLRRVLSLPSGEVIPRVESEMGKVMLEIGPIGFIFWYGLRLLIILSLFMLIWKLRQPFLKDLALVAFWIQAIFFTGQTVFHPTFSLYYWFLSSFVFLLPHLEKLENRRQYQEQLQAYEEPSSIYYSPYREP